MTKTQDDIILRADFRAAVLRAAASLPGGKHQMHDDLTFMMRIKNIFHDGMATLESMPADKVAARLDAIAFPGAQGNVHEGAKVNLSHIVFVDAIRDASPELSALADKKRAAASLRNGPPPERPRLSMLPAAT